MIKNNINDINYDEAFHDYRLALAWVQSEGGNPLTSLMEHGYPEAVAIHIINEYTERYESKIK